MPACAKCDSLMVVKDWETIPGIIGRQPFLKCFKCGSRNITEQTKEEPVGTPTKKCEAADCDRKPWLKGLCYKHYIEKFGEYVPTKRGNGVVLPKKKAVIPETEQAKPETNESEPETKNDKTAEEIYPRAKPVVVEFSVQLAPELIAILEKQAEENYRSLEMQAAYLIDRGLRG